MYLCKCNCIYRILLVQELAFQKNPQPLHGNCVLSSFRLGQPSPQAYFREVFVKCCFHAFQKALVKQLVQGKTSNNRFFCCCSYNHSKELLSIFGIIVPNAQDFPKQLHLENSCCKILGQEGPTSLNFSSTSELLWTLKKH